MGEQIKEFDFYKLPLDALRKLAERRRNPDAYGRKFDANRIISLRRVFQKWGTMFHLTKRQSFAMIKALEKRGWIKFYPYHGVKVVKL